MRDRATSLKAGASVLRNDGSDGRTLANAVNSATYQARGGSPTGNALVNPNNRSAVTVNIDHPVWKTSGRDAQWVIGHESLHSAGLDHVLGPNGAVGYKFSDNPRERQAYRALQGTPQADRNPDHLMDEAY